MIANQHIFMQELIRLSSSYRQENNLKDLCLIEFDDILKRNAQYKEFNSDLLWWTQRNNIEEIINYYNLPYHFPTLIPTINYEEFINIHNSEFVTLWIYAWGRNISTHTNKYIHTSMVNPLIQTRKDIKPLFLSSWFSFLSISSAYRSSAYQLIILCERILQGSSMECALETIAPPFCSKHNLPTPPIDLPLFVPKESWPFYTYDEVYNSDLRKQFCECAKRYNLIISYPRWWINNGLWEPREFIMWD